MVRPYVAAFAYLIGGFTGFDQLGSFNRQALAWRIFGKEVVEDAAAQVTATLQGWGYHPSDRAALGFRTVLIQSMLVNRSPLLEDMTSEALARIRADPSTAPHHARDYSHGMHRAISALGHAGPPPAPLHGVMPEIEGVPLAWADLIERWFATSTLTPKVRGIFRSVMAKAGRWLAAEHPDIGEPAQWTRQTCAAWVAAVDRMQVGDYVQRQAGLSKRGGQPLSPRTKAGYLTATRTFFRDVQEWGWIPQKFNPARALATPRTIAAIIGPNPRVIADDVWAKLLWAGLNLEPEDCPTNTYGLCYPMEMIRAITLAWLFSGLRSDEIARLRIGCVRWQHDGVPIPGDSGEVLARDAVCLLDVPVHKTGTAFTKPVDPLLGKAIEAWQSVRPAQPKMPDRKTGEHVDFLFAHRAKRLAKTYINAAVIPSLCRKAAVPAADVRGNITSHRARSTIATQLYNAKEPMTLFELQAWLGHRSEPRITPRSPRTRCPGPTATPATSSATSAPSRSSSTGRRPRTGPRPPGSRGSTTTLGTGTAATPSSSSAPTGWPAPSATSTRRKAHPGHSCWRPRTTCSACSPPSRSLTTSAQPLTTDRPRSTSCSAGWPTRQRQPDPRHGSSAAPAQDRRSSRSSPVPPPASGHRNQQRPSSALLIWACGPVGMPPCRRPAAWRYESRWMIRCSTPATASPVPHPASGPAR